MRAISYSVIASISLLALMSSSARAALTISDKATENVTCSAGVCAATSKKAVLNVTDLANLIAASPVTIQSGSMAQDIAFDAPFSWTSSNGLTLDSYRSIIVNKPMAVSGPAALTLNTGKKGELHIDEKGKIAFMSTTNSLIVNKQSYVLVDSVTSLATAIENNPSGFYALVRDYDASGDGSYASAPISTPFSGRLEGLGNTVSALSVNENTSANIMGVFAQVQAGAIISDFRISKIDFYSTGGCSGCERELGGFVGENLGLIVNSSITGKVKVDVPGQFVYVIGGLIGANGGTVKNCHARIALIAKVKATTGGTSAGGLIGFSYGDVLDSSASGRVFGEGWGSFGSLMGQNEGNVDRSFGVGIVTCSHKNDCGIVGGLVGDQEGTVSNSYSIGAVGGNSDYVGGLTGRAEDGEITTSYTISPVTAGDYVFTGGFAGEVDSQATNAYAYWDTSTSGTSKAVGNGSSAGIVGLTNDQLKSGLPAGFDPKIWAHDPKINNGYPYLIDNPPEK